MPQPDAIAVLDLGGGLNEGLPMVHIQDREWSKGVNFYPFGSKAVRRGGTKRLTTTSFGERITAMFPYKKSTGEWVLIVAGLTSIGKLTGTLLSTIGGAFPSDDHPWVLLQYKDVGYALRANTGAANSKPMQRFTELLVEDAGIPAPTTAPTLADGGSGVLTAADYQGVYTFYNESTGAESNPSPASNVLTLGASKQIFWSGISVSTTPQVTARRLYRTLPGQTGEYFFVRTLAGSSQTNIDNTPVANLGAAASFNNGLPPNGAEIGDIFVERLFCSNGRDLFFSEVGLPESFDDDSVISVFPDDGHRIRAVHAHGERLIVGKTNKVHYVIGTDRSSFELQTLSDRHGCFSHHSMKSAEGHLFWYGGDNFYRSDGTNVESLSTIKLRKTLDRIPSARKEYVVGAVFPSKSWYVASVPLDSNNNNREVVVYNYKTDAWTKFSYPADAPAFLGDFFDANFQHVLYAAFYADNHLYQMESGTDDFGTAIAGEVQTKEFSGLSAGVLKGSQRMHLLAQSVGAHADLDVYRDSLAAAIRTRNVYLYQSRGWKRYALSTLHNPGQSIRYGIRYSGAPVLEVEGIMAELCSTGRFGKVA